MGAFGTRRTNALIEYKMKLSFSELNFYNSFQGPVVGKVCRTMMCFVLCAGSEVSVTATQRLPPSCGRLQLRIPFRAETGKMRLLRKCIACCVSQFNSYHCAWVTFITMGRVFFSSLKSSSSLPLMQVICSYREKENVSLIFKIYPLYLGI